MPACNKVARDTHPNTDVYWTQLPRTDIEKKKKMSKINLISLLMIALAGTTKGVILRTSCKSFAEFSIVLDGFYDSGAALKSLDGKTRRQCLLECKSTVRCKSINFQKDGGLCQLLDRNITSSKNFLQSKALWTFISTDDNKNNVSLFISY